MTGSTISGTITKTVRLGPNFYPSPLTITDTGVIAPATPGAAGIIVGAHMRHAIIDNAGHVNGAAGGTSPKQGGVGIDLAVGQLINTGTVHGGAGGYVNTANSSYAGGNGVDLSTGGIVTNSGTIIGGTGGYNLGSIQSGNGGIGVDLHGGALTNSGTVLGGTAGEAYRLGGYGGAGVTASNGATVTNASTGQITGGNGTYGYRGAQQAGTGVQIDASILNNAGTITGGTGGPVYGNGALGGIGVELNGGTGSNGGLIAGGTGGYGHFYGGGGGVGLALEGGLLSNTGTIIGGAGGPGSEEPQGAGGAGVLINGGTLETSGTISGGYGYTFSGYGLSAAVTFGSIAGTLLIDPGAVFDGVVAANAGAADVLALGGSAGGTLNGLGSEFTNFAIVTVNAHAHWSLDGANALGAASSLQDSGALSVAGTLADAGLAVVWTGGELTADAAAAVQIGQLGLRGGTLDGSATGTVAIGTSLHGAAAGDITVQAHGSISGFGTIAGAPIVDNGTILATGGDPSGYPTLLLADAVSGSGTVAISDAYLTAGAAVAGVKIAFQGPGLLYLDAPTQVTSVVAGFGAGDSIWLNNTPSTSFTYANNTLTVLNNGTTVDQLVFAGTYTEANFQVGYNGSQSYINYVAGAASGGGGGLADFAALLHGVAGEATNAAQAPGGWAALPADERDTLLLALEHWGPHAIF